MSDYITVRSIGLLGEYGYDITISSSAESTWTAFRMRMKN